MKTSLILIFVMALCVSNVHAQAEWIKFAPEGGNFSALLPVEPKTEVETKTGPIGTYTIHMFTAVDKGTIFMIAWVDYAPTVRLNIQGEIDANRDNFLKEIKGKLVSEQKLTFAGNPGLEFTAEIPPDMAVISRIYVVGQRPYQMMVAARKSVEPAIASKFLSSFKLNDPK